MKCTACALYANTLKKCPTAWGSQEICESGKPQDASLLKQQQQTSKKASLCGATWRRHLEAAPGGGTWRWHLEAAPGGAVSGTRPSTCNWLKLHVGSDDGSSCRAASASCRHTARRVLPKHGGREPIHLTGESPSCPGRAERCDLGQPACSPQPRHPHCTVGVLLPASSSIGRVKLENSSLGLRSRVVGACSDNAAAPLPLP